MRCLSTSSVRSMKMRFTSFAHNDFHRRLWALSLEVPSCRCIPDAWLRSQPAACRLRADDTGHRFLGSHNKTLSKTSQIVNAPFAKHEKSHDGAQPTPSPFANRPHRPVGDSGNRRNTDPALPPCCYVEAVDVPKGHDYCVLVIISRCHGLYLVL